jgi:hypothetical protein
MWLYTILLVFLGLAKIICTNDKSYSNFNNKLIIQSKASNMNCKKIYLCLTFLPLFLISALRSINIGNDTIVYHRLYTISSNMNLPTLIEIYGNRWENGFLIFNKVLSRINLDPQFMIIISSFISLFLVFRFIYKYSRSPALSLFLFITMRFYFFFMSNIRQAIALGVILLSYDYLKKRKLIPFIILVLIATQFHSTAIVFLAAYYIDKLKFTKKTTLIFIIATIVIFLGFDVFMNFVLNIVPAKYSNYVNTTYYLEAMNLANIANFMTTLAVLLLSYVFKYHRIDRGSELIKYSEKSYISYYFLLTSVCLGLLTIRFGMFSRIQHYFYIFSIVLIPEIISRIKDKNLRVMITFVTVTMFCLYHIVILIFRPEWQHVYPYELFFLFN